MSKLLKCLCWNVQSLCNKEHKVLQLLVANSIDVACITETWFSSEHSYITGLIRDYGYNLIHFYTEKRGTGTAILYKDSGNVHPWERFNKIFESFEYKCIKIDFSNKHGIILCCVYRRQEINKDIFIDEVKILLNFCQSLKDKLILVGDFNYHFEKVLDCNVKELLDVMSMFGLSPLIPCVPTHKAGHTLDQIFANIYEVDIFVDKDIVDIKISDHYPIFFNLQTCWENLSGEKIVTFRRLNNIEVQHLKDIIVNTLEDKLQNHYDLSFEEHHRIYSSALHTVVDEVAPNITKVQKCNNEPAWMDTEFKSERRTRRQLERVWRKSKDIKDKHAYIIQRDKCAILSKSKQQQYYSDIIQRSEGDQKALYNIVSNLLDTKKRSVLPQSENTEDLANKFNTYYTEKVEKIRATIPPVQRDTMADKSYKKFEGLTLDYFEPVTVDELRDIINSSNTKTAYHDPLPKPLLDQVMDNILPYLCSLVNKSLESGSMEGVKESIIIPLLKKSGLNSEQLKNYRPVSNLLFLSKIIERVVLKRLNRHMDENNLHSDAQYGYKMFHSTETLMLRLINDVLVGFEKNSGTIVLLLDLSAAFDTVDTGKLLTILKREIGINGVALKWFESFLTGRTQRVKIDNSISDLLHVLFGVPQGSVLGPNLFNIYCRSFGIVVSLCGFNPGGFADDNHASKTFALSLQYNVITRNMTSLINHVTNWMNSLFLKINPEKTEIILFVPKSIQNAEVIGGSFLPGGCCIRFSSTVKNLGLTLDTNLNFDAHVNLIVSHCYKLLRDIGRIRSLLSQKQAEALVHSVISSRLDYCNSVFYGINKGTLDKLQKLQNAAARLIARQKKRKSIRPFMRSLHWLRVEERIIFKVLLMTYKCLNNIAPVNLASLLKPNRQNPSLLEIPIFKTNYGRRSFEYIAPCLWNELPTKVTLCKTVENFKSKLKTFLYNDFDGFKGRINKYTTIIM